MMVGWMQILLIVLVVALLFGAGKIPSIMKNVAEGMKVFKKTLKEDEAPKKAAKKAPKRVAKRK